MVEEKDHIEKIKDSLLILSIGLGIGWLAGLSVSPVATILISGLLGVAITIVGIISISLTYRNDKGEIIRSVGFTVAEKISTGLLALIVFGIALGVSLGICARTHNFLGADDKSVSKLRQELNELQGHCSDDKKWTELGIDKKEVAQRIFDKYYPKGSAANKSKTAMLVPPNSSSPEATSNDTKTGVLFAGISVHSCQSWPGLSGKKLRVEMKTADSLSIKLESLIKDDKELRDLIVTMCNRNKER
ncbi:MAG: hypothetical protein D3905_16020 [Candidatus Electrothrix sp. AS4_5]|nr:hypothetical protein [Candidatus Electrothrix gigas]